VSASATTEGRQGAPPGPIVQSLTIGFRAIYLATLALAVLWLASNVRQVPPDSRAVVLRFGRIVRVQEAGLLLALPRPIESVRLLPNADRQLSHTVAAVPRAPGIDDDFGVATGEQNQGNAGAYMTGDGGIVLLDAVLTWHIVDPAAYVVSETHVIPALNRLFRTAAIAVAARHDLDDFLVARPDRTQQAATAAVVAQRQAVRDEVLAAMNARLRDLAGEGASLGVEIDRIDLTAYLPPAARRAFESVLSATQRAEQALARARTDAERTRQAADRERDNLLAGARAAAAERVSRARASTATIVALAAQATGTARASLLDRVYRDRIAALLPRIGQVTAVDSRGGARVILPGSVREAPR
jgi:regulator of protease activity HflC (stomatin/prohibitin superfamily)